MAGTGIKLIRVSVMVRIRIGWAESFLVFSEVFDVRDQSQGVGDHSPGLFGVLLRMVFGEVLGLAEGRGSAGEVLVHCSISGIQAAS